MGRRGRVVEIHPYTPEFKTGACHGMPNAAYHAHSSISLSKLGVYLDSPLFFKGRYITGELPNEETDALRRGSAQHVYTLEGLEEFHREFAIVEDLPFRSKEEKAAAIDQLNSILTDPLSPGELSALVSMKKDDVLKLFLSRPGKSRIESSELETIRAVDRAVKAHPIASQLLSVGVPEVSFRSAFNDKAGFSIQCRTDWLNPYGCEISEGRPYMADLKTVKTLDRWDKNYFNFGYWLQWPFYRETMRAAVGEYPAERMYLIVAETDWPNRVVVRVPDPADDELAMREIARGFAGITRSIKSQDWNEPGWDQLQIQSLKGWAERTLDQKHDSKVIEPSEQPSITG